MSTKRSAKESGLDVEINKRNTKRHKKAHKSRHGASAASGSESDSKQASEPSSKFIDHAKWKYLRISTDDFYRYRNEFGQWLLKNHAKYLDEMSTKKCKKYFRKFVKKWNAGKLDEKYYQTFSSLSVDNHRKTRYHWSFEQNIDSKEQMKLDLLRDEVDNDTNDKVLAHKTAQQLLHRFEEKRQRKDRRSNHRNKHRNESKPHAADVDFENDKDGIDAAQKMEQQFHEKRKGKGRETEQQREQRRKDRKQRDRDMRRERDKNLLSSYQSFISS